MATTPNSKKADGPISSPTSPPSPANFSSVTRIKFNDIEIDKDLSGKDHILGLARCGRVMAAHYRGESVAVKLFKGGQMGPHAVANLRAEAAIQTSLAHAKIVKCCECRGCRPGAACWWVRAGQCAQGCVSVWALGPSRQVGH